MPPETLEEKCKRLRSAIKEIEMECRGMVLNDIGPKETESFEGQRGEQKGQAMLAVRHLEDARMRLGKVIQFNGTGVSCYDA